MAPDVTMEHTRDLAERMTYKSAVAGVPFGGGKSAIQIDGRTLTRFEKTALLREYCHMLYLELSHGVYIPAPDMGTGPADMAVIFGRLDRPDVVTGKPPRVGGLPGRTEATGRGVAHACGLAARRLWGGTDEAALAGRSVAVQGFGNVGRWTAHFCATQGARVVAITDINGGVYHEDGLDLSRVWPVEGSELGRADLGYTRISNEEMLALDVDILVPAAREDQVTGANAPGVRARLVVEGANGPLTPEADQVLRERGVPVVPDILANAGGVIASYVEWRNAKSGSMTQAEDTYKAVDETLERAFRRVMSFSDEKKLDYRTAAHGVALYEVIEAMRDRCWI